MHWTTYAIFILIAFIALMVYVFPSMPKPIQTLPSTLSPSLPQLSKPGLSSPIPNKVRELNNKQEADEFVKSRGLLMVYAQWCGHCKNMMPAFETASNLSSFPMARLDSTKAGDFMKEHEIRGFPHLIVGGDSPKKYLGGRDTNSLLAALN
jgi:thiol-disulfide isomerase/thioredoxin